MMTDKKKYLLLIVFIVDIVFFAFLTFKLLSSSNLTTSGDQMASVSEEVTEFTGDPEGESYNLLLLGYGGAGHDGGNLTDVVMVAHIDPKSQKVTFISVPRDLWVEVPVRSDLRQNFKINAAYAIGLDDNRFGLKEPQYKGQLGAGALAKEVVSEVSALPLKNHVAVSFESFKNIVDTLGGIDVEVPVAFNDYFYPVKGLENETCGISAAEIFEYHQKYSGFELEKQFTCRYEHLKFEKGKTAMDGESALKFVRSRHSSEHGGDFARSERQRAVLIAVKNKLISLQALKNIDEIYDELKNLINTDLDLDSVKRLSKLFGTVGGYKFNFVSLNEDNVLVATKSLDGQFILIPKAGENVWLGVQKYIYDELQSDKL